MAKFARVRTDNMSGTVVGKDLVSLKADKEIENGSVVVKADPLHVGHGAAIPLHKGEKDGKDNGHQREKGKAQEVRRDECIGDERVFPFQLAHALPALDDGILCHGG